MHYNTLGKTGFRVSRIGLGCEHLQGKPADTIERVVHSSLDGGVNILDVFMSEPQVRSDIGTALRGRRGDVFLQGHIGAIWENGQYGVSRDPVKCEKFIGDFLARLGTDYIDIGMLHFVDSLDILRAIEQGPLPEYMQRLREKGVIRSIGMSSHNPAVARTAAESGWLDVLMFSTNPAYDLLPSDMDIDLYYQNSTFEQGNFSGIDPSRNAMYEACQAHGVGITVMKTYGGGRLLDSELSPFGIAFTPAQLITYALSRPAVASALIGCKTDSDVAAALAYEDTTDEERDYSETLANVSQFRFTKQCVYCNHCHPCPAGIDVAAVNRCLDLMKSDERAARELYASLCAVAGDCTACGVCESRCPFGVRVTERMADASEKFGK